MNSLFALDGKVVLVTGGGRIINITSIAGPIADAGDTPRRRPRADWRR